MADNFNTFKAAYGGVTSSATGYVQPEQALIIAASDETSDITTGDNKVKIRLPYAFNIDEVRASVSTAPTGSGITVSAVTGSTTIGSVTIAAGATSAKTTVTQNLADESEISINVSSVGSTTAGTGLKVTLKGRKGD
tara:strand:- start:7163 stop:7573 length:411 start_codon:yes stop_codon:yes gene_type:complete